MTRIRNPFLSYWCQFLEAYFNLRNYLAAHVCINACLLIEKISVCYTRLWLCYMEIFSLPKSITKIKCMISRNRFKMISTLWNV